MSVDGLTEPSGKDKQPLTEEEKQRLEELKKKKKSMLKKTAGATYAIAITTKKKR